MTKKEKIKVISDYCAGYRLCSDGCALWHDGRPQCRGNWTTVSDSYIDRCLDEIGATNTNAQAVNSFYVCNQHENSDNVKATVTTSNGVSYEFNDAHSANAKIDMVCHPPHYNQGGIECIDAIKAATVNKRGIEAVCVANVIKYLFRYETKNGLEDVRKAAWYIDRLIAELEAKGE